MSKFFQWFTWGRLFVLAFTALIGAQTFYQYEALIVWGTNPLARAISGVGVVIATGSLFFWTKFAAEWLRRDHR